VIGAFILLIVIYACTIPILNGMRKKFSWFDVSLMQKLFWYHVLFFLIYYIFALYSPSDSKGYFSRPQVALDGWLEIYDTGTPFIDFLGYPFIVKFGFSYEMMMLLFSWLGYWGFVYFYIFFKENVKHKHTFYGKDLITIFIFLPNMHYWTASLGKGSIIFWGLALTTYGISNISKRKFSIFLGMLIVYQVRPHVFFVMLGAILVGFFTGRQKVPFYQKMIVLLAGTATLILMYDKILAFANLDGDNVFESFDALSSHRAQELAKSNSGIDISNYPLIFKFFTFWYRPLFIDSPGPVGLLVSFENMFYLALTVRLFKGRFLAFFAKSDALVKTSAVMFLGISFALSGTLSNLGIIIRQKSMVMYYFLFIILAFLEYKKVLQENKKKTEAEQVDTELEVPNNIQLTQ